MSDAIEDPLAVLLKMPETAATGDAYRWLFTIRIIVININLIFIGFYDSFSEILQRGFNVNTFILKITNNYL